MKIELKFIVVFSVIASLIAVNGIFLSILIQGQIEKAMLDRAKLETADFIIAQAKRHLTQEDFAPVNYGEKEKRFSEFFTKLEAPDIIRIKVWSNDGTIIFSDNKEIIGQKFPENHEFQESIGGEIEAEIAPPVKPENIAEQGYQQLMEVYVPIRFDSDEVVGVIETYTKLDFLNQLISNNNALISRVIVVSISCLVAAIFVGLLLIRKSIVTPLMKLKEATNEIRKGNLHVDVKVRSNDEIGELAFRFDEMRNSVLETNTNLNRIVERRTKELEIANIELRHKDKLKDEFLSVASHELRTPIQPILNYVELAKKGHIKVEEAFEGIAKNAKRLQQLANDILDVGGIESGQLTYTMTNISLNDLILNVASSAKVNLNGDVSLITKLDSDVQIYADPSRITQVLTNVIGNAIKFTTRGTIEAETRVFADKNEVEIKISDTGTGIPDYILPDLFGKFVTSSTKDKTQSGRGLGLYTSKAVVNAHKGEISAHNNSKGGATFTIVLPIDSNKRMN